MMTNQNPLMTNATGRESADLAHFASGLSFDDLPSAVVDRTVDLFADWAGSALSGMGQRAVAIVERFAAEMGPADGAAEILTSRAGTSPYFAALANAATRSSAAC